MYSIAKMKMTTKVFNLYIIFILSKYYLRLDNGKNKTYLNYRDI